ncbi:hypothetical protein RclHR1_05530001 [Rhizophagus clarus]|uniref:Uncharacterized protein n=1 Tax=Rhizophagus clarus TaxID=94130 RepID=A0A2Z6S639_9GLOM|nr:hypothetical protein RclHR1_05530001 [Rhizophagus clarus]GET03684.1 hypothetical protein GLOIN_2v1595794 [Rhizophagus clarus]
MRDHFKNPGQCATAFNLGRDNYEVIKDSDKEPKPYDFTFFKKGLNKYCHEDFHCTKYKMFVNMNSVSSLIGVMILKILKILYYRLCCPWNFAHNYTEIPGRKALCIKNNHGDFCSYEFVEKLTKWMKKKMNTNPKAIISHDLKFVIKGDGKKIHIPRSFICDPCWKKMANIYGDYMKEHKLKKSVKKNIWGYHQD